MLCAPTDRLSIYMCYSLRSVSGHTKLNLLPLKLSSTVGKLGLICKINECNLSPHKQETKEICHGQKKDAEVK